MYKRLKEKFHRLMAIRYQDIDENKSLEHVKILVKLDEEWGLHELGYRYDIGFSVDRDSNKAVFYYKRCFEKQSKTAKFAAANIGNIYFQGRGLSINLSKAAKWFRKAAELGHPESQYYYGYSLIEGWDNPINDETNEEAILWIKKSAKSGIPEAVEALEFIEKEKTGRRD